MSFEKVLIIGAGGMLGSMLFFQLMKNNYDVLGTIRKRGSHPFFSHSNMVPDIDVWKVGGMKKIIDYFAPDTIINCAAITQVAGNVINSIKINAIFPQMLALIRKKNMRIIHYSTDAVYGNCGYELSEKRIPRPDSLYGLTKLAGEPHASNTLVLRTSMIGPELENKRHLLERIIGSKGKIPGYENTAFTGITTLEHAAVLIERILPNREIAGIYNLGAPRITKKALIEKIIKIYKLPLEIIPGGGTAGYNLNCGKFNLDAGYTPPSWDEMLGKLRSFKWNIGGSDVE